MKPSISLLLIFICLQAKAKVYAVGVENIDYSPHYNFTSKVKSGYIYDLLNLFSSKSHHTFKYVPLPIKRLRKSLRDNNGVDLMYPDNPLWEDHWSKSDMKT